MIVQEKLTKAQTGLILDHPFFGTLVMRLALKADPTCQTASVNGKRIRYNPAWIESLTLAETKGVLAHEVMHVAAGHCWRRDDRPFGRWNLACDYAINGVLTDADLQLPEGAAIDPCLGDKAAEDVFALLPDSGGEEDGDDPGNQTDSGGSQNGAGSGDGDGDNGQDDPNGADSTQENGAPGDGAGTPTPDPGGCGAVEDSPEPDPSGREAAQQDWRVAVAQAASVAKSQGELPGSLERLIGEIVNPAVDWRTILRDFVQFNARSNYDWSRPNRRYIGSGIVLPGIRSQELPPIVVAVDTSGSIGQSELDQFATEIEAVLAAYPTEVHLVYCDAAVQETVEITRADLPLKLEPKGGGGTDFRPVFAHVEAERLTPSCLIYLTDLYGYFPDEEPEYPVLWVATTERNVPFGEVARIGGD